MTMNNSVFELDVPISLEEVRIAIKSLKGHKAVGWIR